MHMRLCGMDDPQLSHAGNGGRMIHLRFDLKTPKDAER